MYRFNVVQIHVIQNIYNCLQKLLNTCVRIVVFPRVKTLPKYFWKIWFQWKRYTSYPVCWNWLYSYCTLQIGVQSIVIYWSKKLLIITHKFLHWEIKWNMMTQIILWLKNAFALSYELNSNISNTSYQFTSQPLEFRTPYFLIWSLPRIWYGSLFGSISLSHLSIFYKISCYKSIVLLTFVSRSSCRFT